MHSEGYSTWFVILSVGLSVCYHIFSRYVQQDGQKAIPTSSVPHWLYFLNGIFGKNAVFESYGMKTNNMQIAVKPLMLASIIVSVFFKKEILVSTKVSVALRC